MADHLGQKIKDLPLTSGVYLMKDGRGRIIYVGKAVSLRRRVSSYFQHTALAARTAELVRKIRDIEVIPTASEAEALILEAGLIKKIEPKYNIALRDDKSYPYIEITSDSYPRIFLVRPRVKNKKSVYYGPYVNPRLIREALTIIRKAFPFCICSQFPKTACLDAHIGLCDAPCVGEISESEYKKNIRRIRLVLEGRKDELYRKLRRDMERLAREKKYEKAARIRDQIQAISALYSASPEINHFKEIEQLKVVLGLPKMPQRIEAFDISNIMGQQSVGSMISFVNGKPDKSQYRRFRIKTVEGIDDFDMIREVVRRRYTRLHREGRSMPDLIVIDGGKGQLSAAVSELDPLDLGIPILSLAKREEEIFLPHKRNAVILPRDSLALNLVRRVRDEAHRFALAYHRQLRGKDVFHRSS